MKNVPYALVISNLMYAQVRKRPDIAYDVGVLGRYLSDSSQRHWIAAKRMIRYLKGTKYYMLAFRRLEDLIVTGYLDLNFASCPDDHKSTNEHIYMMVREDML